jgi:hypothetical protein
LPFSKLIDKTTANDKAKANLQLKKKEVKKKGHVAPGNSESSEWRRQTYRWSMQYKK